MHNVWDELQAYDLQEPKSIRFRPELFPVSSSPL